MKYPNPIDREITFHSDNLCLAGSLTLPEAGGPFPAVLLLPGSGEVDRNENHKKLPINVLREIAGYLAERGIASLRYDKRGVGPVRASISALVFPIMSTMRQPRWPG